MIFRTVLAAIVMVGFLTPFATDHLDLSRLIAPAEAETIDAGSLSVCSGGNRAERRLTCIVDGDTGWLRGEKWRLIGTDTPEISHPECDAEYRTGIRARDRLRILMSSGYSVERDGSDRSGRALVTIRLADGRDVGDVLEAEGLSQPWPNSGNRWCR